MIIQAARLLASKGADDTCDHVFRGEANDRIIVIRGSEQALHDMVHDARAWRRTYAIRHIKVCPREVLTREQLDEAVADLAREFGFDAEDAVVVGHVKPRLNGMASPYHLHVLVPEVNPVNGRVLSSGWNRARQEKVSRLLEARWGHAVVQGAFNKPVLKYLRKTGRDAEAELLLAHGLDPRAQPQGAYRTALVQEVERTANAGLPADPGERERLHRTLPQIAEQVRQCRMLADGPEAFAAALRERRLRCVPGQKNSRWVVEVQDHTGDWHFCNALHRVLKQRLHEVDEWMGKWTPTEEEDDAEREAELQTVGSGRVRRTVGGHGRAAASAGGGQAGNDAGGCRRARRGKRGEPADVTAGPAKPIGRRNGPGQNRELVGRAGHRSQNDERAAERRPAHPLATSREGGGREGGRRYLTTTTWQAKRESGERLRRLVEVAAIEQRYRGQEQAARLQRMLDDVMEPIRIPSRDARNRTIRCAEDDRTLRERQLRFRALLLRRAYVLADHVPIDAVINLRRVDTDPDGKFVLLTLTTGTQLLDTGDRITVRGQPDDIAIEELVACCARRGWTAVEVTGDEAFRIAASRELLRQGIEVVDCPLSEDEMAELRVEADNDGFDWSAEATEPVYAPTPPWVG